MHAVVQRPHHQITFRREPKLRSRHVSLGMKPATETDVPTWYVLNVFTNREEDVTEELLDLGFAAFCPMERVKKLKPVMQRKKGESHYRIIERALFPGYVLVGLDPAAPGDFRKVLMVEHAINTLRSRDGASVPIPRAIVERFAAECAAGRYDQSMLEAERLAALIGQTVTLPQCHALAGLPAKVTKANRKGVEAEVFLFGATRAVQLSVQDAKAGA